MAAAAAAAAGRKGGGGVASPSFAFFGLSGAAEFTISGTLAASFFLISSNDRKLPAARGLNWPFFDWSSVDPGIAIVACVCVCVSF